MGRSAQSILGSARSSGPRQHPRAPPRPRHRPEFGRALMALHVLLRADRAPGPVRRRPSTPGIALLRPLVAPSRPELRASISSARAERDRPASGSRDHRPRPLGQDPALAPDAARRAAPGAGQRDPSAASAQHRRHPRGASWRGADAADLGALSRGGRAPALYPEEPPRRRHPAARVRGRLRHAGGGYRPLPRVLPLDRGSLPAGPLVPAAALRALLRMLPESLAVPDERGLAGNAPAVPLACPHAEPRAPAAPNPHGHDAGLLPPLLHVSRRPGPVLAVDQRRATHHPGAGRAARDARVTRRKALDTRLSALYVGGASRWRCALSSVHPPRRLPRVDQQYFGAKEPDMAKKRKAAAERGGDQLASM